MSGSIVTKVLSNQSRPGAHVGRAAAVLTTSPIATRVVNVSDTLDGVISVFADFTVGALDSVEIKPQINDGNSSTWNDCTDPGTLTLTASGHVAFSVNCKGSKMFRCLVTGSGTVTSSSLAIRFGWLETGRAN